MQVTARSRRNHFWFGTEKRAQFIPTPNSGADESPSGWDSGGTLLNGGGFQLNSFGSHKEYVFEWPSSSSRQMAQLMRDYKNGSYGRGLIYFHDPLTFDTNVLPAMWADPSIGIGLEGSSLIYGLDPVSVPTTNRDINDLPVASAQYNLASIASGWRADDSLFIPIPEGFSLVLGAMYTFTGTGAVYYRTQATDGALGALTVLSPVGNGDSDILNTVISGSGLAGIRIQVGRTSAVSSTVTLTAMCARLIETSATVSTVMATNVFTNPRCVASGGTVEVRRNLATNPKCGTGTSRWGVNTGTGGVASGARVTGLAALGFPVDTGYRATWTTGATSNTGIIYSDSTVVQNTAYSVGVSILATKSMSMRVRLVWRTTVGGSVISQVNGPVVVVAAGVVTLVQIANATAPATAANLSLVIEQTDAAAQPGPGDAITASAVLIEAGSALRPYFDGDGPSPDPDLTPAWLGAVNGSASVLNGQEVSGVFTSGDCAAYRTTSGKVKVSRKIGSGNAYARFFVANAPGTTTAIITRDAVGGTMPEDPRLYDNQINTNSVPLAPSGGGEFRITTAATGWDIGRNIIVRPGYNSAPLATDWAVYSMPAIICDVYNGPAFSGSTPSDSYDYRWTGAVDNSTSQQITQLTELNDIKRVPWLGGQGHSGCRFINNPTYIANTGVNGGQIGFSASFREVGSWVNG